jgi:hypothetical protein
MVVVGSAILMLAPLCSADTVIIAPTDPPMTPGAPTDQLVLSDPGQDAGSSVFTENTQYDFSGLQNLQVIGGVDNSEDK